MDITESLTQNNAILTIKLRNCILNGLYKFLHKTYFSQNNNQSLHILDNLTQIILCSMNVDIVILEINKCWFASEVIFVIDIKKPPLFQREYVIKTALTLAVTVSYQHSVCEHTVDLFLISDAVTFV